jgi:hypothetical protein
VIAPPPVQCTSPRRGRPEELTEIHPNNPLQTEPEIGKDYYYAASADSPNAHHHKKIFFVLHWLHCQTTTYCCTDIWGSTFWGSREQTTIFWLSYTLLAHRNTSFFVARQLEDYSDEAHLSAIVAAIQYSDTLTDTDGFSPDLKGKDGDSFSLIQNPIKIPISSKVFLRALPHCPIIHRASQLCNNPEYFFCPCSIHSRLLRGKNKESLFMMIMNLK